MNYLREAEIAVERAQEALLEAQDNLDKAQEAFNLEPHCRNCRNFEKDPELGPEQLYGKGICKLKTEYKKVTERRSYTDWCDRHAGK